MQPEVIGNYHSCRDNGGVKRMDRVDQSHIVHRWTMNTSTSDHRSDEVHKEYRWKVENTTLRGKGKKGEKEEKREEKKERTGRRMKFAAISIVNGRFSIPGPWSRRNKRTNEY